ncbi:hypothetical protein CHITON_1135 [Thermococcus chitonophagus]|uniref:Uncharacterized protein n=1 Tax=Thermococcus chitonophagus TaxID=54262 RepID=A0A170SL10_9EURY|nr:hypothetical protein CHITON_1135 [Thermococcus chitonophagus]
MLRGYLEEVQAQVLALIGLALIPGIIVELNKRDIRRTG